LQIIQCHKKGFTLVELVLSIALIALVAFLIAPMFISGVRSYSLVADRKAALAEARLAMDRMTQEIRLIPSTDDITTWDAGQITFNKPTENNITYTLAGGNLTRNGAIMAENVDSLAFSYLDQNGDPAVAKADIERVRFEMVKGAGTGHGNLRVRNQVFPRRFSSAYAGFQ